MKSLLPLILMLSTCASAAQVSMSAGQTAVLGDQKIIFLSVNDNRCPINARCVRAGELTAKVLVSRANKLRLLRLQLPAAPNTVWNGLRVSAATVNVIGSLKPKLKVTFSDQQL